jgi:calcineurin-like phosphoesterase family protein
MKQFVISDLHLGDLGIINFENRPFSSLEGYENTLINNWNSVVSNEDEVFILGDTSQYSQDKTKDIINQLNGRKILVLGNHDRDRDCLWWIGSGFNSVSEFPIILPDKHIVMSHEPPTYYNNKSHYFYIYGHVHTCEMYQDITSHSACVCVERIDYKPIEIDILIQKAIKLLNSK